MYFFGVTDEKRLTDLAQMASTWDMFVADGKLDAAHPFAINVQADTILAHAFT